MKQGAAGIIAVMLLCYFALQQPAGLAWQDLPPVIEGQQFRIVVGLKDAQPRRWQGKITVAGGELVGVAGWRFSGQDRAAADGAFNFITKQSVVEDQLRPGSEYGQTGFGAPPEQKPVP